VSWGGLTVFTGALRLIFTVFGAFWWSFFTTGFSWKDTFEGIGSTTTEGRFFENAVAGGEFNFCLIAATSILSWFYNFKLFATILTLAAEARAFCEDLGTFGSKGFSTIGL